LTLVLSLQFTSSVVFKELFDVGCSQRTTVVF